NAVADLILTDDLLNLNERYGQAGIQFRLHKSDVIAPPTNVVIGKDAGGADIVVTVDLPNGLDARPGGPATSTNQERALILGARKLVGDVDGAGNPIVP